MISRTLLLALALLLVSSTAAHAATVSINGQSRLSIIDGVAETNSVTVGRTALGDYQVTATTGTLTPSGVCSSPMAGVVTCPAQMVNPNEAVAFLGGDPDTLAFDDSNGIVKGYEIRGEDGNDTLTGGGAADFMYGDAGDDDMDGGAGNDDELFGGPGADVFEDASGTGAIAYYVDNAPAFLRTQPIVATMDGEDNDGSVEDGLSATARDNVSTGMDGVHGSQFGDDITGSSSANGIYGGDGNDTLTGGAGADTLGGGNDADDLFARDGESDAVVDCDLGGPSPSTLDNAQVDAAAIDTNVVNCEEVDRPATGGTGGGGGGSATPVQPVNPAPATSKPKCPASMDVFLRADYDVDKFIAGKMALKVDVPERGWKASAVVAKVEFVGVVPIPVPLSNIASVTATKRGLQTLTLGSNATSRGSSLVGRTTKALIAVTISAPGCPLLGLYDAIELAPKPDGKAASARATRKLAKAAARAQAAQRGFDRCEGVALDNPLDNPLRNFACGDEAPSKGQGCETSHIKNFTKNIALSGCFKGVEFNGPGGAANIYRTASQVKMNGLVLDPANGSSIDFDNKKLELRIKGKARAYFSVLLPNGTEQQVTLFDRGGDFSISRDELLAERKGFSGSTDIAGFPIAADVGLRFDKQAGIKADLALSLPSHFGGAQATANLTIPHSGQVQIDEVVLTVPTVKAYNFTLADLQLSFKRGTDPLTGAAQEAWFGKARVIFPDMDGRSGPQFDVETMWKDGKFERGAIKGQFPPAKPFGPAVTLDKVNGEITMGDPLRVKLGARLLVGPKVAPGFPPDLGEITGELTYTGPANGPGVFEMLVRGKGSVRLYQLAPEAEANVQVRYATDGNFAFGGNVGAKFSSEASVFGAVAGTVTSKEFAATGLVLVTAGPLSGSGHVYVNNNGAAGCLTGRAGLAAGAAGGFKATFKTKKVELFQGCGFDDFKPVAVPSQRGNPQVSLPAGLPSAVIAVRGAGGALGVVGPDKALRRPTAVSEGVAYFAIAKPPAGAYDIAPDGGSAVRLTEVRVAEGTNPPKVDADITRDGAKVKLKYKTDDIGSGERLTIIERAEGVDRVVGTESGRKGSLRFVPQEGGERKRKLFASFTRDGVPTGEEVELGSFSARPAPFPGRVADLELKRRGADVTAVWDSASDAESYRVEVREEDGRRRVINTEKRTAKAQDVGIDDNVTVRVIGVNDEGAHGPISEESLKGRNPKKRKPRPLRLPDPDDVGYVEVRAG